MPLTPNAKLGPYEIVSPLGAGGMGEVYRARDTRLDRDVAIKVLPDAMARDPQALARFEREAKSVAALSHPHILAVYDVGRHEDISYVVMELLEGETLRSRISRSALPSRKATEIGIEIAEGLSAAHAKGVIHRDLKPENIFLTAGHVKILDFGLARSTGPVQGTTHDLANSPTMTLETRPGAIIGTLCYMAPEQIRALATDARTDIFAFGCVMYEMLTGKRAFLGETAADTMTAILKEEPTSVRSVSSGVGLELERLIDRCLEKRPEQRFQSSADLAYSLRSLLSHSGIAASDDAPPPWFTRTAIALVVIAALVVGVWVVRRELRQAHLAGRETIDSIAVLPLENVSRDPEQEYFVDGMTEALISDLAKIGGLKVISRTSVMRYKATPKSLPEIAKELNVDAVVEGSVLRVGDRVRINAQLIRAATDQHLWAESYEHDLRDVLSLQGKVARAIAEEIKVTLTPQERARLAAARPVNPAAHEAYLKGRFHWHNRTRTGMETAIEYFRRAIDLDPQYAPAYAGMADARTHLARHGHVSPKEAFPLAKQAALKAVELDDALAEAHGALAVIALYFDWNWTAAEHELRRALNFNESYEEAHHQYSHLLLTVGRPDESLTESRRALELDPLDLTLNVHLGWHYMLTRQYEQAITQLMSVLEMEPNRYQALRHIGWVYIYKSLHVEAIAALEAADKSEPDNAQAMTALAAAYAAGGRGSDARALLQQLEGWLPQRYVSACDIAAVYSALNEVEVALAWLEKAYEERSPRMIELGLDPVFDSLRSDPRFVDLVRRVGIPLPTTRLGSDSASPLKKGGQRGVTDGKIMLAVLPFTNDSGDKELDYLSDGIAETLINGFSRVEAMNMVPRSLTFKHKGEADPVRAGRELSATAVLSGRILKRGDSLTVQADLVDVAQGRQLWGERYQRKFEDLVQIERDIAADITDALRLRLTGEEKRKLSRGYSENAEAYRLYLQGRYWWTKRTKEGLESALRLLGQAIELDPEFALAHSGIADTYSLMPMYGFITPREGVEKAQTAAERALRLDDQLAEAHTSMGMVRMYGRWDFEASERDFKHALELNPRYPTGHQWYALCVAIRGRLAEAKTELRRAIELDPLAPIFTHNFAWIYSWERDWAEALSIAKTGLEFAPEFPWLHQIAGQSLLELGKADEALVHFRKAVELAPLASYTHGYLGHALGRSGHAQEARALLTERLENAKTNYAPPTDIAAIYVGLGENNEAFSWLEKGYQVRDTWMVFLGMLPQFESLRGDPRFDDLLRRVGLPLPTLRSSDPPLSPGRGGGRGVIAGKIMLAVLPFENISGDPEQEYFSDGLTEEMITQLGRLNPQKLAVIARSSAMHYKNMDRAIGRIKQELGVDYVVEGSVRRADNRVRITAKLIQCTDQSQVWANSFERELKDILALQSDVSKAIAQEIQVTLSPQEQARMVAARTINPAAHEAYLKGRFHWNKRTRGSLQEAVRYFEQAISLDPDWPLGYAGLGDAYLLLPWYSPVRPGEAIPKARAAAAKALEIDESLAEAHATMAVIAGDYDRDWPTAEREFQRAMALSPNYPTAHQWYALELRLRGRHDEALREATKAQELDPLSLIISLNVGEMHYNVGDWVRAETQFRKTLEFGTDFLEARIWLVHTLFLQGRIAEAITEAREAVRLSNNDPRCASTLGYVYAKSGQTEEARRILDEITARSKEAYVAPTYFALVHAGLDERDRVFEWLERAYQEHAVRLRDTLIDPLLAEMRSDPRFSDLVRRAGLPPLATSRGSDPPLSPTKGVTAGNKHTLAVLPFVNQSGNAEDEYFSDGITDELASTLAKVPGLRVAARSSAFTFKGKNVEAREVGEKLGVAALLEGTVRRSGLRLRVTAQLVNATDGMVRWSEKYEREAKDVFAVQDDITGEIVSALQLNMGMGSQAKLRAGHTDNAEAHDLYLRGRFFAFKRTEDGLRKGLEYFQQAIEKDPNYAPAYAGIAFAYNWLADAFAPPHEAYPKAKTAVMKALELDPENAEAHSYLALSQWFYDWNFATFDVEFRRALQLNPNSAEAHHSYALTLCGMGRTDEGLAEADQGVSLDPLSPATSWTREFCLFMAGRFDDTLVQYQKTLELDPNFFYLESHAALVYRAKGMLAESVAEYQRQQLVMDGPAPYGLAVTYARMGRTTEARAILTELMALAQRRYVPPDQLALIHAGLGELDQAFVWLDRAYEARSAPMVAWILRSPDYDPLRSDPRFDVLLRKIGFKR